mgnify:CR=1 FL=1
MAMNQDAKEPGRSLAEAQVTGVLMDVIVSIPESGERLSPTPELRSAELIKKAATTTAGISGGAALVPGPLGLFHLARHVCHLALAGPSGRRHRRCLWQDRNAGQGADNVVLVQALCRAFGR